MAKRIARAFMTVFGTAMGVAIVASVDEVMKLFNMGLKTAASVFFGAALTETVCYGQREKYIRRVRRRQFYSES